MSKTKRLISLLCLLSLLLCGCGGSARLSTAARRKVYFIVKSTETEFWLSAIAGGNAAKAEYNIDLTVLGPETEEDFEAQNRFIRQAVEEGAEAIVFSAISYEDNAAAIDQAAAAGLKIVIIDSDVDSDKVDARIGTDNVQAGRMTGAAVLDTDQETLHVGVVNFDRGSRNGQEREQGLREALAEDARVAGIYTVNVSATLDAARTGVELLLAEHPEINALVGLNEPLAVGVGRAAQALGLKGRARVVGFDSNVQCIDLMREGVINALIVQNPYAMGYLGVERAWALLSGEAGRSQDWMDTATTIVTRENLFSTESQKALFSFG